MVGHKLSLSNCCTVKTIALTKFNDTSFIIPNIKKPLFQPKTSEKQWFYYLSNTCWIQIFPFSGDWQNSANNEEIINWLLFIISTENWRCNSQNNLINYCILNIRHRKWDIMSTMQVYSFSDLTHVILRPISSYVLCVSVSIKFFICIVEKVF